MNIKLLCILAFLLCIAIPAASAVVVVDTNLQFGGDTVVSGGGYSVTDDPDTRFEVEDQLVASIDIVFNTERSDWDTFAVTYQGGTYTAQLPGGGTYTDVMYPQSGGSIQVPCDYLYTGNAVYNSEVYYSWLDTPGATADDGPYAYYGYPAALGIGNLQVEFFSSEVTQHVTVSEPLPWGNTYFTLEREGVVSLAEYYFNGELSRSDTSSSDWSDVLCGPMYGTMRLDVTINGETKSVSWGVSEPTPTPTPTPSPTPTLNPIRDNNTTAFSPDDYFPSGGDPVNPRDAKLPSTLKDAFDYSFLHDYSSFLVNNSSMFYGVQTGWFSWVDGFIDSLGEGIGLIFSFLLSPVSFFHNWLIDIYNWLASAIKAFTQYLGFPVWCMGQFALIIPVPMMNLALLVLLFVAFSRVLSSIVPLLSLGVNMFGDYKRGEERHQSREYNQTMREKEYKLKEDYWNMKRESLKKKEKK